jgi:2-(1,2-epoxy-1,2-dihydrophenyl)acetyl-CoA isomerase
MYHLPRLIGMARAKQFLFGRGELSARQAEAWGLVAEVVPDESLETAGLAAAARLAAGPVDAMGLAKSLMARSFETSLMDMFAYEGFGQVLAMASGEFHEGLDALLERRKPDFAACANRP